MDTYDPAIRKVLERALAAAPSRRKGFRAKDSHGRVLRPTKGVPEQEEVGCGAVDFSHHQARIENGR